MLVRQTDPCPCGSGRIFRNCCLPQMMAMGMAKQGQEPNGKKYGQQQDEKDEKKEEVFKVTDEDLERMSPEEKVNAAAKLSSLKREDEAIEVLETVLNEKSGSVDFIDIFYKVIDFYKNTGNYRQSLIICEELIKYDEEKGSKFTEDNMRLKAELLIKAGAFQEGINLFKQLIEKNPEELWNYYAIANALTEHGDIKEAIKYIEKGISLQVTDIEKVKVLLRRMLGKIKERNGD